MAQVCIFWRMEICAKAAHRMLLKLTTGARHASGDEMSTTKQEKMMLMMTKMRAQLITIFPLF